MTLNNASWSNENLTVEQMGYSRYRGKPLNTMSKEELLIAIHTLMFHQEKGATEHSRTLDYLLED